MPRVPWLELEEVYRGIATGRLKLIGWGASGSFKMAYAACPLRVSYLIDRSPALWGQSVWGLPVRSPSTLQSEDPEKVVVLIYSAFLYGEEILAELEALGPYRAIFPYTPLLAERFVRTLTDGIDPTLIRKPAARSDRAILVQGPVLEGITAPLLRFYASRHPHDRLSLSTWSSTSGNQLDAVAGLVDDLVLSDLPACPGPQNRNLQRQSTMAGLERLAGMGIRTVLKTRTDTLCAGEVLSRGAELQMAMPLPAALSNLGLRRRFIISERYTYKYLPYALSDIAMFGDIADHLLYWSAPDDLRSFSPFSPDWRAKSLRDFSRTAGIPEIHFFRSFCERIGRPLADSVEDHWAALRDLFILMDENWFDLYFPKYGFDDVRVYGTGRTAGAIAHQGFWERLAAGENLTDEAQAVDIDSATFADVGGIPPGLRELIASTP
ncbi:hypothetical protein [Azospirillum palustre]